MPARLIITDGTTEINLLDRSFGFHLDGWEPAVARYKQGGTFSDSPLADGRRLVDSHFENVFETFELKANAPAQDTLIRDMQELRRLLEKAASYWTADWATEPVWIEARASQESNLRYSLVVAGAIANDDDPFQMPFLQPDCTAVMDELDLVVEREPFWRADVPGESTCVAITGSQEYAEGPPWYLIFNGTTSVVAIPDNAQIQDMPNAGTGFRADSWIRLDSYGELNAGRILDKTDGIAEGWNFMVSSTLGLVGQAWFGGGVAISRSGLDELPIDGLWHHVHMSYSTATRAIRLFIDAVEVTYTLQQVSAGAYVTDVGNNLYIGNTIANNVTFDGDIGWTRVQSSSGVPTSLPPRCTLPAITVDTQGQWIGVENTGATIDNQEGLAAIDGTQTNCTFDGCPPEMGRAVETCLDEVYVANKHNQANITHIFTWSAANGFSANLAAFGTPYDLVDIAGAAPAVNDYVVFGIDTSLADSGPFASLVFDIGTAISGITADDWEYSSGAGPVWTNLPAEQDNTNQDGVGGGSAFDTTGVGSVHWDPLIVGTPWTAEALNGVTAYWVRVRVTAVPGPHVAPTQQNRDIYSIVWPFVDIAASQVGGDITAVVRIRIDTQADNSSAPDNESTRIIAGLRSLSRGVAFTPYLNLADEQNPSGVTVAAAGAGSFADNLQSATGRIVSVANPGASAEVCDISLGSTIAYQYDGVFHAYLRGRQNTGTAGNISVYVTGKTTFGSPFWTSPTVTFPVTGLAGTTLLLDLGLVDIPAQSEVGRVDFVIFDFFVAGNGVDDCELYDFILMPVDEYSCDALDWTGATDAILGYRNSTVSRTYLDIDNVYSVKKPVAMIRRYDTDGIRVNYHYISPGPPILQSNSAQRLWFLSAEIDVVNPQYGYISNIGPAFTILLEKNQRYLSMRGDR